MNGVRRTTDDWRKVLLSRAVLRSTADNENREINIHDMTCNTIVCCCCLLRFIYGDMEIEQRLLQHMYLGLYVIVWFSDKAQPQKNHIYDGEDDGWTTTTSTTTTTTTTTTKKKSTTTVYRSFDNETFSPYHNITTTTTTTTSHCIRGSCCTAPPSWPQPPQFLHGTSVIHLHSK